MKRHNTAFKRLIAVLEEFRKLDPQFQSQKVQIFLYLCDKVGELELGAIPFKDIERAVGLEQSSTSRMINGLSEGWKHGDKFIPGLNLIRTEAIDGRTMGVRGFTVKGRKLNDTLTRIMED